ncbi:MAG: TetR/AcrR family transcriptional regulator [Bacillota bacterium]
MNMKQRILSGFREMANSVGFHAATMDELSSRTGISKRTIYRYFNSKDDLVNAVMDEIMTSIQVSINAAMASSENPVEKIRSLISTVFQNLRLLNPLIMRDLQKYYPHVWDRIESFRAQKIQSIYENMLAEGIRQGYFRDTIPEVFVAALLASIRNVVTPAFILENNLTLERTALCVFDIFLHGVLSEEPRKTGGKSPDQLLWPQGAGIEGQNPE